MEKLTKGINNASKAIENISLTEEVLSQISEAKKAYSQKVADATAASDEANKTYFKLSLNKAALPAELEALRQACIANSELLEAIEPADSIESAIKAMIASLNNLLEKVSPKKANTASQSNEAKGSIKAATLAYLKANFNNPNTSIKDMVKAITTANNCSTGRIPDYIKEYASTGTIA